MHRRRAQLSALSAAGADDHSQQGHGGRRRGRRAPGRGLSRRPGKTSRRSARPHELRLLGPAEAEVFRLKGYYRYHFQLQSSSSAYLHQVLRQVLPVVKLPSDVQVTVDIDPQDML